MNTSNGNVVQTQGLSKTYKGVKALDSLNLQVSTNSTFIPFSIALVIIALVGRARQLRN
jgi:hypothetical protein